MKKILFVTGSLTMMVAMISCGGPRTEEGRAYMPDMAYSRAYETYASTEALDKAGVHYTAKPVDGTIARGEMAAYPYKNDSIGYVKSAEVMNPGFLLTGYERGRASLSDQLWYLSWNQAGW